MSGQALQINAVSTSAADGGGSEGLISSYSPSGVVEGGYNYGFTDGFIEMGSGTPGALPFRVDENGIATAEGTKVAAPIINTLGATNGGSAVQLSDTTRDYMVYLAVNTAGTATTVSIGHTSAATDVAIISATAVGLGLISFRLPAGWYFKWAGTTTTISVQNAVGC